MRSMSVSREHGQGGAATCPGNELQVEDPQHLPHLMLRARPAPVMAPITCATATQNHPHPHPHPSTSNSVQNHVGRTLLTNSTCCACLVLMSFMVVGTHVLM